MKPSLTAPYLVGSYMDPDITGDLMNGNVHAAGITELVITAVAVAVAVAAMVDDIIGIHYGALL